MTVVKEDCIIPPDPGQDFPGMVSIERAALHCGCCCFVGKRLTDLELVTAAIPCSPEHNGLMEEFRRRYGATEDDPKLGSRPAVDVADQVLMAVAADLL